ncbi:MAG: precorrin-6A reductase [Tissierellaceae bacterium]|nr:precorrin-6A reductase [Tissierellaceae bacterium]
MIWIIGGTSEARRLIERLGDFNNYILTIATEEGKEFFDTDNLFIGRLSRDEMIDFAKDNNIDMIVDLSHPYAKIVSENARFVSEQLDIEYKRYVRKIAVHGGEHIYLNSYEEAYEYILNIKGTIFFTTGSKNIKDFEKVRGDNRFIYRVLPALESIELCKKSDVHMRDIVAILGPFSKEFNKSMLSTYNPDYCVMKDSGHTGGTVEKIQACKDLGIKPIIIGREEEEGIMDLETIEKIIRNK